MGWIRLLRKEFHDVEREHARGGSPISPRWEIIVQTALLTTSTGGRSACVSEDVSHWRRLFGLSSQPLRSEEEQPSLAPAPPTVPIAYGRAPKHIRSAYLRCVLLTWFFLPPNCNSFHRPKNKVPAPAQDVTPLSDIVLRVRQTPTRRSPWSCPGFDLPTERPGSETEAHSWRYDRSDHNGWSY